MITSKNDGDMICNQSKKGAVRLRIVKSEIHQNSNIIFVRFWLHCARQEVAESVSLVPTKALHANENHFFWRQLLTAYVAK